MNSKELRATAESNNFFCYAAGVAYYMREFYDVRGVEITNYKTTLPVKKGLSSSAAFCVLVAKAFNEVYNLNLKTRAIIEAAYQGEIMTSSRCGRMDQGCAYGQVPVKMTFDGELMYAKAIAPGKDIHMLVADLNAKKDTIKILADLNRAYPFPQYPHDEMVHEYLGALNALIIKEAQQAIIDGDAPGLGRLMNIAQSDFDKHMMPMCSELKSPVLHSVLDDTNIRDFVFGGKGVGSQGDGCVQFVTKGPEARAELMKYLNSLGMTGFELDLKPKSEPDMKRELSTETLDA
jgi:mevalonate kinase